jgi:formylmethanofuran dehydrogenase subunit C
MIHARSHLISNDFRLDFDSPKRYGETMKSGKVRVKGNPFSRNA